MSDGQQTLASIAVELFADDSKLRSGMQNAVGFAKRQGDQVGSAFALGFSSPLLNAIGGIRSAISGLQVAGMLGVAASGIGYASRIELLALSLRQLTGSAGVARDVAQSLQALSDQTLLDPATLIGYSRGLIGIGVSARDVTADLKAMADANQALTGGDPARMAQMVEVLTKMRGGERVEPRLFRTLFGEGLNLDAVVGAGMGRGALPHGMGQNLLEGMNPVAASEVLFRGFEKVYRDAAEQAASGTLTGIAHKIESSFEKAMGPTGALLLHVLEPIGSSLVSVSHGFELLNNATGGGFGLVGMIGLGVAALRRYGGSLADTSRGVIGLTGAIQRLGAAADASSGLRASATSGVVPVLVTNWPSGFGIGTGSGSGGALVPYSGGAAAAEGAAEGEAAAGGLLARLGTMAKGPAGIGLLTMGGGLLGNYIGEKLDTPQRSQEVRGIGGALRGAGTGAMTGLGIGMVGGPDGMAIGAIVGGLIGAGVGMFGVRQEIDREKASNATTNKVDKLAGSMDALTAATQTAAKAYGLNDRGRATTSQIEREFAVYSMARAAWAGIG